MRCQKFFLTRFITKCLIFIFFLNCAITAEAGMVLGEICFKFPEGSENKKNIGVPIYRTTQGKIEEINDAIEKECTIEKVCKDDCLPDQIKSAKIQLIRFKEENFNCYHYKVFISSGKYHMQCDNKYKCSAPVISYYWSSLRDINFTLSGEPPVCEEIARDKTY